MTRAGAEVEIIELSDDDDDAVVDVMAPAVGASASVSTSASASVEDSASLSLPSMDVIEIKDEAVPLAVTATVTATTMTPAKKEPVESPLVAAVAADPIPEPAPSNRVMIMGYSVDFPEGKKPFPAQLAVMNKVLLALKTGQHALLESPTGSGKTLALLCSSLTFQRKHVAELVENLEVQRKLAAEAHAAKVQQIERLNQQKAEELYSRTKGMGGEDGKVGVDGAASTVGVNDDDDFASTQPSFDQFRFSVAVKSIAVDDGWISMENKKTAMKLESGGSGGDADDDFDSQPDDVGTMKRKRVLPSSFATLKKTPSSSSTGGSTVEDEDDDMESPPELKKLKTKRALPTSFAAAEQSAAAGVNHEKFHSTTANDDGTSSVPKRVAPPKIFFCSRTHSQLSQVVEELKNCPMSYIQAPDATNPFTKELKMCVLGSKANFCVNKKINTDPTQVDEKCRNLMDMGSCSFANKRRKTNDLRRVAPPVWDIEDMVVLAKRHRECGFYHARDALVDANIVFCPYNYILDPSIRAAVSIELKNSIVIFDEAHNVEDTCRSSASMELNTDVLALAIKAFTNVIKHGNRPPTYHSLLKILNGLNRWIQKINANASTILKPTGFEEESKVWSGVDALAMFAEYTGMTQDSFEQIKRDLAAVGELERELSSTSDQSQPSNNGMQPDDGEPKEENEANSSMLLGTLPLSTVQMVINVADYMFRDQLKYLDDFKLIIKKSRNPRNAGGRFRGSYTADTKSNGWELKMCIWCLNAAVAFSDVIKLARSVILTSGTLSPMDSFAGELGTDFPIRLEANHVVNMRKQVFAGAIMHGPGGVDLSSTFTNQQEFRYQDSMGQLLLQYSQVVPGGILMFFPSYSLMDKLVTRWKQTGLWGQIDAIKTMYSEPRKAGKDFDALLDEYKYSVAGGRAGTAGTKTGAVFLAVYRGKVSEGIDFSNDNARAVLCVGIPFPNVKELQVSLKRKYQDEKSRVNKKLVSGNVWYQLQAFRALNQALGRCIRHRQDYGTILLLDSRHRAQAHTRSLSKWMRPFIQEVEYSEQVLSHFIDFFKRNELELGTGAVQQAAQMEVKRNAPMVLKYEQQSSAKNKRTTVAVPPPPSTMHSTMTSVKAYMEKRRLEVEGPRVFSLFKQSKEAKPAADKKAAGAKSSYARRN